MGFREDLKEFTNALGLAVNDATSSKAMRVYGKMAIRLITARTRAGFGVTKTGKKASRLAKLRPATVESRRRSKFLNTGLTSPGTSNLTFTGQLIESLLVKKSTSKRVIIGANRKRRKGGITNEELASLMEKGDSSRNRKARPFLNVSTNEIKKLNRTFSQTFDRALKRRL